MKTLSVIRTHTSSYQAADFLQRERQLLESLAGIKYGTLADFTTDHKTVLITNTHTQLSQLPPEVLEHTALIIHPNSGYDHFMDEYQLCQDIPLVIGHKIRAQAVAEYSLHCLFEGVGLLPQHLNWDQHRKWERRLISELNIWVFGYGHIGKIVADTLKTLGAKVTVVDRYLHDAPHELLRTWQDGEVQEADVIISCMGLNQTNHHLFNEEFFHHVNPELIFINGARGKLVSEEALKNFLVGNPKAFAYLDVFEDEPFTDQWKNFPQVWKTSHIAGVSTSLDQKILDFEFEVLKDYLELNSHFFMMKYYKELIQNKWIEGVLI